MKKDLLMEYREKLLDQKLEFENTLRKMKNNGSASQSSYYHTDLSNYDNHPADIGTELYILELNNALRVHEENLLGEVQHALKKIDEGKYGQCELCGREIKKERLDAIPYTRVCASCEQDKVVDPELLKHTRPNEERVIDAPLGRKYLNRREDDEHEGLDYLNDLAKYGNADSLQDMGGYHDYDEFYTNEIDNQGIVDHMDKISNEEYRKQLP
jgi:YteA family regulatory protein